MLDDKRNQTPVTHGAGHSLGNDLLTAGAIVPVDAGMLVVVLPNQLQNDREIAHLIKLKHAADKAADVYRPDRR